MNKKQTQQLENRYSADLVATYEELTKCPPEKQLTAYFGDLSLHYFKYGVTDDEVRNVYAKALDAMKMTEDEFNAQSDRFRCRYNIIKHMRESMLTEQAQDDEVVPVLSM